MNARERQLPVVGWREWVALPGLGIRHLKAKIDTGARSSSLHAFDVTPFERDGQSFVRFAVHPKEGRDAPTIGVEAAVADERVVRSSNGVANRRIVIVTPITMLGETWPIEVTLANRTAMRFPMLVGREALEGRLVVDPGLSYCGGKPPRRKNTRRQHP